MQIVNSHMNRVEFCGHNESAISLERVDGQNPMLISTDQAN